MSWDARAFARMRWWAAGVVLCAAWGVVGIYATVAYVTVLVLRAVS